ncbi:siroheme synthase CysG [Aurantivibrio infirmus]
MEYLPLFFDVKNQRCLIVGGGDIALRKAQSLIRSQAIVDVVAVKLIPELQNIVEQSGGKQTLRAFQDSDVNGYRLVIAATDDEEVNQQVSAIGLATNCLVNVVDNPKLSNFVMPAVIDRDPLVIAISSSGEAPVLARQLRAKIETLVPANYGKLAQLAGKFRDQVKRRFISMRDRRRFWENVFQGVPAELALSGNISDAEKLIQKIIKDESESTENKSAVGEVYLVGAGPGDPDLLTFRALRLMQQCDVCLYDRLVSPGVMDLVRKDADKIYVGKRRSDHAVPQLEINNLLADLAEQGKRVLRLKGGDPFIFGRGGEEIELLSERKIPFQVVPGITAASGCASYSGIPLTHRDYAQSVRFITGHLKTDKSNINFKDMLDPTTTLVFYMGLIGLPEICQGLIEQGRSPDTPAALIEKGTTTEQRVFTSTIAQLASSIKGKDVHAPTLLVIGDVVRLHEKLSWFRK